jgi:hypothetical protein
MLVQRNLKTQLLDSNAPMAQGVLLVYEFYGEDGGGSVKGTGLLDAINPSEAMLGTEKPTCL